MQLVLHRDVVATWPRAGRHVLASYDDTTVVVYQAYRPSIARFAVQHGYFGGNDFSLSRMSWIKPCLLYTSPSPRDS